MVKKNKEKRLRNWSLCITHGQVIEYVLANGGEAIRITGSHKIIKGPNGHSFPIQCNHLDWRMVPEMKATIKRQMQEAGIPVREEG